MQFCWNKFVTAVLLMLASFLPMMAQTNTTSLTGEIQDATGATINGGVVTLTNPETGLTQATDSNSTGQFSFNQIPPGKYTVKVSAPGFAEQVQKVELLVATPARMVFKLSVGGANEVVSVETSIATINSDDGTLGKAFNSAQVSSLPYLANNITYLLSLQPGVLGLDPGATTGGLNQDPRTGTINGARQDQTNATLDGVDNNDQNNGFAFNGVLRSTRDSVEEFRVVTTNGNADSGRSSGAQVSLVTKSGTNAYHGSAYWYYRDPGTSSNNWFLKQSQLASNQPNTAAKILQHTYGASFGAPIIKDKLFFFGAYEGFTQATNSVVTQTVPSLLGGGGLITGAVSYQNTSGGTTTLQSSDIARMDPNCTANGTCPYGPGTDAAAITYYKKFPLANSNTSGDSYNTGGYTFASPAPIHQFTNIVRLDYNLTSKQSLFVRGNLQSDNLSSTLQFPGQQANSSIYGNNRGIAAGHVWNINSKLINNFRYGYVRQGGATRGAGSQPNISITGISSLTSTTTSSIYIVPTHNFADDVTFTKGRHTIQFGFNNRLINDNRYADSTLYPTGSISADLLATAAIAGKGTSLDPGAFTQQYGYLPVAPNFRTFYNNAILANTGIITFAQSFTNYSVQGNSLVPAPTGTVPSHNYRSFEQEYYVQDQWRVMPRLSLTAGLRYTYLGVPYEIHGQQVAPTTPLIDLLQNRVAAATTGGSYNTRIVIAPAGQANGKPNLWTPQKLNFAPRIALAYSTPDNRTAIRGGYSLAFDHFGLGVVNYYDANGAFALSTQNPFAYTDVDTAPRFTGFRDVPIGSVSIGNQTLPVTPADQNFSFVDSINNNIKTPYAETFNLTVQHEFARGLTVTASYVGRLGRHVLSNLDITQPSNVFDPKSGQTYFQAATAYAKMVDSGVTPGNVPNSGYFQNFFPNASYKGFKGAQAYYAYLSDGDRGNETDPLFKWDIDPTASADGSSFHFFYPQYSSVYVQSSIGTSNYNALQLSVRHVLRYGLEYDLNYTYGKSMDMGSSPERAAGNSIINTFNPAGDYSVSDYDVRHNITANYSLPLPFGHGTPFMSQSNGFVDRLISGWSLNGVVHYSSAFPFSAVASGNYGTNFANSSYFVKTGPIASGGHRYVGGSSPFETALKSMTPSQAFANLRYAYPGETGQRNAFRADGYMAMDNGLSKSFRTFREQQFKISVEVFNLLNNVRFSSLNATANDPVTATPSPSRNFTNGASTKFAQYTNLLVQPRQMQFSGKYIF
jgi:Carboxypeptidase regulatory-like domain